MNTNEDESSISIYTLHNHFSTTNCDCIDEWYDQIINNIVIVSWDDSNKILDEMMLYEYIIRNDGIKRNCEWVEKVKEKAKWERGNVIYINNEHGGENIYLIIVDKEKHVPMFYINEEGILMARKYDTTNKNDVRYKRYDMSLYEECDCVYNERITHEMELEKNG